ncbi:hypothetical protein BX667DRAFT_537756 [Coemansia mojavensis]|nr:hypothetical protein BX667DRAFT_537756 [Coemansia mojavensis]
MTAANAYPIPKADRAGLDNGTYFRNFIIVVSCCGAGGLLLNLIIFIWISMFCCKRTNSPASIHSGSSDIISELTRAMNNSKDNSSNAEQFYQLALQSLDTAISQVDTDRDAAVKSYKEAEVFCAEVDNCLAISTQLYIYVSDAIEKQGSGLRDNEQALKCSSVCKRNKENMTAQSSEARKKLEDALEKYAIFRSATC